jgi:hypothetical protein
MYKFNKNDSMKQNHNHNHKHNHNHNHNHNHFYINNYYIKSVILKYLYSKIDISELSYKIISYNNELSEISNKFKYIQLSHIGSNNFLLFIKIENRFYSVMIDKRSLNYNFNKLDINRVKIIKVNMRFSKNIYDGTIFDGIYLINKFNKEKKFIINDVYYLTGNNMMNNKMKHKFYTLESYLDINPYVNDSNFSNIIITLNKCYELNEINDIFNDIKTHEEKHFIKGLHFIKEKSGHKIIYFLNNNKNNNKNNNRNNNNRYNKHSTNKYSTNNKYNNKYSNNRYNNKVINMKDPYTDKNLYKLKEPVQIEDTKKIKKVTTNSKINGVFEIKKTDISDVYELFLLKYNKNTKTVKLKKNSIAYIPTADHSNFCRTIFKENKNENTLLVNCSYNFEKQKWTPYSIAKDKKRPEFIHKVQKKITT